MNVQGLGRVRIWLGFVVLIAIPAFVLAVIGLRTGTLEQAERRRQIKEQQDQTALLADTTLAAALSRIEESLRSGNGTTFPSEYNPRNSHGSV